MKTEIISNYEQKERRERNECKYFLNRSMKNRTEKFDTNRKGAPKRFGVTQANVEYN